MVRLQYLAAGLCILMIFSHIQVLAGTASPSLKPDMPAEVRSIIEVSMTADQYLVLAGQSSSRAVCSGSASEPT